MFFPNRNKKFAAAAFILTLSVSAVSCAQPGGRGGKPHGPPPEATEACKSLSVGDACSFSGRHGDVTGTCFNPPEDEDILACAPKDMPRR